MSFVVIDLQGFKTPEFIPKEMAIWDGQRIGHYVFKQPFPFKYLSESLQRQANWLSTNYHKLNWVDGDVEVSRIPHILEDIRKYADIVYCKGRIKSNYLKKYLDVIDLDQTPCLRNLPRDQVALTNSKCFYHENGICAVENAKLLYDYILHPFISPSANQQ